MFTRRNILIGGLAMAASTPILQAEAHHSHKKSRKPFKVNPIYKPQRVRYRNKLRPGTIIVDPRRHFLYLIENNKTARRYGVGVGKAGLAFKGSATISRKAKWPSWTPTANMIRREPKKYARYANGVPGGLNNPLGARALYLYRGGRDTYYRIHGTTQPSSIGRSVSNGCIRMINEHVVDLYQRVPVGTRVIVV